MVKIIQALRSMLRTRISVENLQALRFVRYCYEAVNLYGTFYFFFFYWIILSRTKTWRIFRFSRFVEQLLTPAWFLGERPLMFNVSKGILPVFVFWRWISMVPCPMSFRARTIYLETLKTYFFSGIHQEVQGLVR